MTLTSGVKLKINLQNAFKVLGNNFRPEQIYYGEIDAKFKVEMRTDLNERNCFDCENREQWLAPEIIRKASLSVS